MKPILAFTLLFVVPGLVCSADPPSAYPPEPGFQTVGDLREWANSHEWTGGSAGKIELDGVEVFYSMRSFTSGIPTTELIIYSRTGSDLRIRPILVIPTQRKEMKIEAGEGGKSLRIETYSSEEKKWVEMLTVSKALLPG